MLVATCLPAIDVLLCGDALKERIQETTKEKPHCDWPHQFQCGTSIFKAGNPQSSVKRKHGRGFILSGGHRSQPLLKADSQYCVKAGRRAASSTKALRTNPFPEQSQGQF